MNSYINNIGIISVASKNAGRCMNGLLGHCLLFVEAVTTDVMPSQTPYKRSASPPHDLNDLDEFTRESLAVRVQRHLGHEEVQECLTQLFCERAVPVPIRSDNGPEFIAHALREWLNRLNVKPLFIEPGSPWENGYVESFDGKMRDELLNREIFYTPQEAQILIERWRNEYNYPRPHSSLGYRPPASQAWLISPLVQLD